MPLPLDAAIGCAVASIPDEDLATHLAAVKAKLAYQQTHLIETYFPDRGRFARDLYPKHLEFFWRGQTHRVRLFLAANRVGKTLALLIEVTYHMTGNYPDWWDGRRFDHPVRVWLAGDTAKTVRDIIQRKWLGPYNDLGTGVLPQDCLVDWKPKQGLPEAIELVQVRHASGGISECTLKSYDQRREAFQGTEMDIIGLDEEPGNEIKTECLLRVMPTGDFAGGMLILTFTPLMGLTETVLDFCPDGQLPEGEQAPPNFVLNCGWDDVPHLSAEVKAEFLKGIPQYQIDARTRGLPVLGAGLIYPVPEEAYLVEPFELPKHWRRGYALDVGWKRTAALWGAYDSEHDTWYLYHEYYRGEAEPTIHATGIRAPGEWISGVFDPAARGRSQIDGRQLAQMYLDLGLDLHDAENAVESGIYACWERLSTGRLKVFTSLANFRKEIRLYHRDAKGKILKKDDHLMDCLAPETKVITRDGHVPIRDLVGTCGEVLGFDGQWTPYRHVRLTREAQQLYRVCFDDGSHVDCTADHKFMTPHGWVRAIDMAGLACYKAIPTKRSITDVTDFAPTTVNLHGGAPKDWTERSAPVVVAEPYSPAISTFLHEHADVFAVPVCAGVDALHVSDTYCMEVPHGNAFAVEGGILVHNCLRYLVASKGEYARAVPVPTTPKPGPVGFGGRGGWMRG